MSDLVARDRRHGRTYRSGVTALEVTPQWLSARWPVPPGLLQFRVHGVWVHHALQEPDLVRLLRDAASLMGRTFALG